MPGGWKRPSAVAVVLAVVACSSSPKGASPGSLDVSFDTGPRVVPPGDSFECFYTDITTKTELSVNGASASQSPGGHHVTIYYADQSQPVGHHACVDSEMLAWHQIAADAGNKEGIIDLPPGYATRVPAGKQIVVQSHYVNATSQPQTADDAIVLHVLDPSQVKQYASSFVMNDQTFSLPPLAQTTSVTECDVPRDLSVILLVGHMHGMGLHYRLEEIDGAGAVASTVYDTDWQPSYVSHPPVNRYDPATPLALSASTRLRQTCTWQNSSNQALAFPAEMCVLFSYYVPDAGFLSCHTAAPGTDAGAAASADGSAGNCVPPGYAGNEKGIGAYCDASTSCPSGATVLLCTASFGAPAGESFCTTPCSSDADCGTSAYCNAGAGGSGCVPAQCGGKPKDAGTD